MSSSDFSGDDYEFAVGSIKGIRTWDIDSKGRLRGITCAAIWAPGENVARCFQRTRCPSTPIGSDFERYYFYGETRDEPTLGPRSIDDECKVEGCENGTHPATHTFDPSCECGFWAYDELGFTSHGRVTGIIEGYGRTTIGTKGFRCEKARVVALAREDDDKVLTLSEWLRLKELYPDAEFYDDQDDMVTAHGQVLRTYPAVDEDFWTEPVEARLYSPLTAAIYKYASALAIPPSYGRFFSPPGGGTS